MPRRTTTPKHRALHESTAGEPTGDQTAAERRPRHRTRNVLHRLGLRGRRGVALAAAASLVTAGVAGVGVAAAHTPTQDLVEAMGGDLAAAAPGPALLSQLGDRGEERASRSAVRQSPQQDKQQARMITHVREARAAKLERLQQRAESGGQVSRSETVETGDPKSIALAMLPEYGWSSDQFECLDALWTRESGWDPHADNPTSSAYGIPQALPGSKMASAGADWADNPATQIRWGLGYIRDTYGSPCSAWGHSESNGWY